MRAQHELRSIATEVAAEFSLSAAELNIVDLLGWIGPTTMGRLAAAAFVSPSNTTHTIKRLESIGLAQRSRSAASQRVVEVALTDEGQRAFSRSYTRVTHVVGEYLADRYSERELKELDALLAQLRD